MKDPEQIHYIETISITFEIPIDIHAGITDVRVDTLLYNIAEDLQENVLGGKFAEHLERLGINATVKTHNVL